jgi:2-polyprenyl-6-methoxyphenol hydroxylase-like FAD-dependent oxidoreductase
MDLDMSGLYYSTLAKRIGIFGARQNTEAKASFFFASEPLMYDRRDSAQQKEILRILFAGEGWEVPRLLTLMDSAPDFYFDSISQIKMDRWSKGRISLVGELKASDGDHAVAFARYENSMREYVEKCQKLGEGVDWFVPKTRLKFWLSRQIWKILPYTPWKNMMIEIPARAANSIKLSNSSPDSSSLP